MLAWQRAYEHLKYILQESKRHRDIADIRKHFGGTGCCSFPTFLSDRPN